MAGDTIKETLMKRLLILLLLLPSLAWGEDYARMNPYILGGGVSAAACTPAYGTEQLTAAICTDDSGGNEADAYTGWTAIGSPTLDSTTGDTNQGTYKLEITASGSGEGAYRSLSLTNGKLYKLSAYVRHTGTAATNGEFRCYVSGSSGSADLYLTKILTDAVGDQTYAEYVKFFYFNGRADIIWCGERNGDNDGGVYVDNVSIKEVTTTCLGNEMITDSNAATDDTNATTGFTMVTSGSGTLTYESATPDPPAGQSYYLQQNTANDGDRFYMDLGSILSVGTEYFISWKQYFISGSTGFRCGLSGANSGSYSVDAAESIGATNADTSWVQQGFSFTYATASHRYFICTEGATDTVFAIDQLTIKPINSK
jgi:hypothetical protein